MHELLETAFTENWPIAREHIDKVTKLLSEIIAEGNRDGEFAVNDPELSAILDPQRLHSLLASPPAG